MYRIRKGVPSEARVVARVLPPLLLDFFPAQEIMNKVIGEFLSSQQPHPELMAQVLFKVRTPHGVMCWMFQSRWLFFLCRVTSWVIVLSARRPICNMCVKNICLEGFVSNSSAHLYSLPLVRVALLQESLLLTVTWEMLVYIDCYFWSLFTPLPWCSLRYLRMDVVYGNLFHTLPEEDT